MNCNEVNEHVSALIDDELCGELEGKVNAHLNECSNCRTFHQLEQSAKKRVEAVTITAAPAGLRDGILASISGTSEKEEKIIETRVWSWGSLFRRNVAFATAAAVVIFVGVFVTVIGMFGARGMTPFINSVYAFHVGDSSASIDVTHDFDEITDALAKDLSRDIPVPKLSGMQLRVEGVNSRVDMEGRHCGVVKYRDPDRQGYSHFVICCMKVPIDNLPTVEGKPEFHYAKHKGVNMIFWRCNITSTTRCLASKCSRRRLVSIVEELMKESEEINKESK